jgi:hypothetical protein
LERQVNLSIEADGGGRPVLKLTLANASDEPVTVYRHSLPWVGSSSILLVAVQTDRLGTVLAKNTPVDDPGPEQVTIAPGETMSGTISMADQFPDFANAIKSRDVIAFWSYECTPVQGVPLARVSGAVLFPRSG